jgi:serine/threonine protein kinase
VSDLADGEMLSSFLERRRGKKLPVFEALHLIYALAKGVEQIHFLGEYHGDIHSDNVMVKKRGLGFEVHLLDFLDLGRASREKIQNDVYLMISLLYEILGGPREYQRLGKEVKGVVLGNKRNLIGRHFKTAGHLRLALENLTWEI